MENYVSASILSADMLNLGKEIERLKENQIDMVHFDVMDGVFVNNITYGIPILKCINDITDLTLDVHLMITDPLKYVDAFAASGADIITFHLESSSDPYETIKQIHKHGIKAAIAVKPNTPAEDVLTVEPGFGGQSFIADTVDKIVEIKEKICELNLENVFIQVDGGIDNVTSETVKKAGANVLVSGSYLFKSKNMKEAAMLMRKKLHA